MIAEWKWKCSLRPAIRILDTTLVIYFEDNITEMKKVQKIKIMKRLEDHSNKQKKANDSSLDLRERKDNREAETDLKKVDGENFLL